MEFWRTMKFKIIRWTTLLLFFAFFIFTLYTFSDTKSVYAQQPTGSIPTVTGSPTGPMASVIAYKSENDGINIRSGPNVNYDVIGKMWIDATLPVLGKSPGGDWLLVKDPSLPNGQGWVFSFNVNVTGGEIPVAEVPPTPLPKATVAIDPTLAAQFITTPLATKLPTFTPSAPLVIPTFDTFNSQAFAGIPIGLIILALLGLGLVMALFSYFTAR
jgi:hypothetical protein